MKLQDLPYRLLVMLVERAGEIVTREEVRQRLWPENTFVEFDNSLGVAIRKVRDSLNDDAEAPRYVETIPRRGYRFLAPVTVQDEVDGTDLKQPAEPSSGVVPRKQPHRSRYWVVAALVVLMVGAAVYDFRPGPRRSTAAAEAGSLVPPVRVRRSVAVLGFRNLPGRPEDAWLSTAFSEMLNTELAAGGGLRLVSGEDVARAKRELPLADEDSLAKTTLERLRSNPGADVVVLGSYTSLSGKGDRRIRLDIRLQNTADGETIAEEAFTGSEDKLFELASQAGVSLRQSLGAGAVSEEAVQGARASLPSNQRAARLYAEGRAKLWRYDSGARELLQQAVAADPNYPLAHSALSEAWWHSGYEVKARAEAQRALDLSGKLPQEERLLVEGQYRRAMSDFPGTVEAYQSLFRLFPDSLDYGLLLASAQIQLRPADARHTLDVLRHLPAPTSEDARIDMMEASAWINTDFTKAQAAAKRAIAKASAQGSHAIVSRTYGILCQQDAAIGASDEAISDCLGALQSGIAAGNRNGEALMRNDLASLYFSRGDLAHSEKMFRDAIDTFRQVGNPGGAASALANWGAVRLTRGDLAGARNLLQQAIPSYQAVEDKEGVALALNNLGDLNRQSGNLGVAETTYQQAKATAEEIDDKSAIAFVLSGLGDVLTDRGDLAAARKSYEESLAIRKQVGEKQLAEETQLALAQLSIEEGHPADAEAAVRKCKEQFHQEQQADDELTADVVLIQALLAQNKHADAQKEVESGQSLATNSQNSLLRLQFALISSRVALTSEHPASSRRPLEQVVQEARRHGFLGVDLEAQLALAQLAGRTEPAAAQKKLVSLEKEAHAKGFGLIARKAASARADHG